MIVFGLGSGRSGSQSLARLLGLQPGALVTHEKNPHDLAWTGAEDAVLANLREFEQALATGRPRLRITLEEPNRDVIARLGEERPIRLAGDVAFYYLPYVRTILAANPDVRFICLRRDRESTIDSFLDKTVKRRPFAFLERVGLRRVKNRNHWVEHDGTRWDSDPVWDRCFPKYDADDKRSALEMYWDDYYQTAERLQAELPDRFRLEPIEALNDESGQDALLEFVGVPEDERVYEVGVRENDRSVTRR